MTKLPKTMRMVGGPAHGKIIDADAFPKYRMSAARIDGVTMRHYYELRCRGKFPDIEEWYYGLEGIPIADTDRWVKENTMTPEPDGMERSDSDEHRQ